jgi:hypothetical protein
MDPARMFKESLTSRPELENSQGQSRRFAPPPMTSGLPPKADTVTVGRHVSKGPQADLIVRETEAACRVIQRGSVMDPKRESFRAVSSSMVLDWNQ